QLAIAAAARGACSSVFGAVELRRVGCDVWSLRRRCRGGGNEVVAAASAHDPAQLDDACTANCEGEQAAGHGGGQQRDREREAAVQGEEGDLRRAGVLCEEDDEGDQDE